MAVCFFNDGHGDKNTVGILVRFLDHDIPITYKILTD